MPRGMEWATRMRTSELDYELPPDRIAVEPASPRDAARLMVIDRATGRVTHRQVRDLPELGVLRAGDAMVVNRSRVLPARFGGTRLATGGRIEGLYLSHNGPRWRVLIESRGRLMPGERLGLGDDRRATLTLLHRYDRGEWEATLDARGEEALAVLMRVGTPPLPPYIRKARRALQLPSVTPQDTARYNTVYAADAGSVAAPTAGLHFTPELLARLDALGVTRAEVTLHVGLGTFAPVEAERLEDHRLHAEWTRTPAATLDLLRRTRAAGGRVLAVGTTTVRTLESLPEPLPEGDHIAETSLLIAPGFVFRSTDLLLTNFHLPRSSLMALVAALPGVGVDRLKHWYALAVAEGYRFYSYGDAMLLA